MVADGDGGEVETRDVMQRAADVRLVLVVVDDSDAQHVYKHSESTQDGHQPDKPANSSNYDPLPMCLIMCHIRIA